MCIEREFECYMQAYGSCDKVLMREMRMEILIVVSVLTCGVIVHLCTCAFSVVMSMQCVHAHVGVEYILLSLVALLHSMYVCVCACDLVLTSEFYLRRGTSSLKRFESCSCVMSFFGAEWPAKSMP